MNELILKLREQAGLQPYYDAQESQIERFAELIVREICDIVEEDGSAVLPLVIKRRFGVEE